MVLLVPPLRLRGRMGVFRRREGYLLAAQHLGLSLRAASLRSVISSRGASPAGLRGHGPALPSSICTSAFLSVPTRVRYVFWGSRTDVLAVLQCFYSLPSKYAFVFFCVFLQRFRGVPGRTDVLSRSAIAYFLSFSRVKVFSILRYREADRILRVFAAGGTKCLMTSFKGVVQLW